MEAGTEGQESKPDEDKEHFEACTRHGRRNACPKIVCKCQTNNPDATEHAEDCTIVLSEEGRKTDEKEEGNSK